MHSHPMEEGLSTSTMSDVDYQFRDTTGTVVDNDTVYRFDQFNTVWVALEAGTYVDEATDSLATDDGLVQMGYVTASAQGSASASNEPKSIKIVVIADSTNCVATINQLPATPCPGYDTLEAKLDRVFGNKAKVTMDDVIGRSIGGNEVNIQNRIDALDNYILGNYDVVVMVLGTNDFRLERKENIYDDAKAFSDKAVAAGCKVILVSPIKINADDPAYVQMYNRFHAIDAEDTNFVYEAFRLVNEAKAVDGRDAEVGRDGVHPTSSGRSTLANGIYHAVAGLFPENFE